ncbi:MAG: flagellar biosynthesis protein FlgH [Pseudobdellovibrio sp.]
MKRISGLLFLVLLFQGCASLVTNEDVAKIEEELTPVPVATVEPTAPKAVEAEPEVTEEEPVTKYSEINNMAPPSDRQYKRMTRKKMEEESELYSSAGSLWKMEGQTSYLFAENKHRREGDPTSIKMEGAALKMIENKVAVISDLLKQLETQRTQAEEDSKRAEEEKIRLAQAEEEKKLRADRIAKGELVVDPMEEEQFQQKAMADAKAATDLRKPAAVGSNKSDKEEKFDLKDVEIIPSKIVEKMSDDTYRIRGQQYLTIKKKPYKVIATALIRAEDFNDGGVSSNKLLDAQYDVIHVKRAAE